MLTEQADRGLVRKRWAVARRLTLIWRSGPELTWSVWKTRIGHVPTGRTKLRQRRELPAHHPPPTRPHPARNPSRPPGPTSPPPGLTRPAQINRRRGRHRCMIGAGAASLRHGSGVSAARERRQCGVRGASLRRGSGVIAARELREHGAGAASARRGSGVNAA